MTESPSENMQKKVWESFDIKIFVSIMVSMFNSRCTQKLPQQLH